MIYRYIIFFLLFLLSSNIFAQIERTYHWYFGYSAGLNFGSGIAVADTNSKILAPEGCATMSDSSGNLLFYTNGITVWNTNHDTMPNGTDLMANLSSTQGALIVPKPGKNYEYYIFTNDGRPLFTNGLRYSLVDMTLGGGLGGIVIASKNIPLLATSTEKLTAVEHSNNRDIWVIAHEVNSTAFYAYLVTDTGINNPVISNVGAFIDNEGAVGQMKASPNSKRLAFTMTLTTPTYNLIQIFDFDNKTGIVSNHISLKGSDPAYSSYGVSFSPNSNILYVDERVYFNLVKIYQFDLLSGDSAAIQNSKIVIGLIGDSLNNFIQIQNGSLQLGPDGKIYHTTYDPILPDTNGYFLNIINNPDILGLGCNFVEKQLYLGGKRTRHGLPNFIESYFYINNVSGAYTIEEKNYGQDFVNIFPNPVNNYLFINPKIYKNDIKVSIHNILGKLIYKSKVNFIKDITYKIDLTKVNKGIYFLEVSTKSYIIVKKILIN